MKISVITVTLNALPALRKTINSVIRQNYADFEYIVVDGDSMDGTKDFLAQGSRGISLWISEPDKGIYEAMNKGVRLAQGDFCIFMNAGDLFVNDGVLAHVDRFLSGSDIVLGNEIIIDDDDAIIGFTPSRNAYTLKHLLTSSTSHQATFIRRSLLVRHPYDESLRLVSDWKFILERIIKRDAQLKTINVDVCFFRAGGATFKNLQTGTEERRKTLETYPEYYSIWSRPYRPGFFKKSFNYLRMLNARFRYQ